MRVRHWKAAALLCVLFAEPTGCNRKSDPIGAKEEGIGKEKESGHNSAEGKKYSNGDAAVTTKKDVAREEAERLRREKDFEPWANSIDILLSKNEEMYNWETEKEYKVTVVGKEVVCTGKEGALWVLKRESTVIGIKRWQGVTADGVGFRFDKDTGSVTCEVLLLDVFSEYSHLIEAIKKKDYATLRKMVAGVTIEQDENEIVVGNARIDLEKCGTATDQIVNYSINGPRSVMLQGVLCTLMFEEIAGNWLVSNAF